MRDLAIQTRENDLVVGTFGRGIYILDDYTALRAADTASLEKEAVLFPVRNAWMYEPTAPLGFRGKAFLGDSLYAAANPPFGAVFTYYLKDELKTRKKLRQEREKKIEKDGGASAVPDPRGVARRGRRGRSGAALHGRRTTTATSFAASRRRASPVSAASPGISASRPRYPTDTPKPDPSIPWVSAPTGPMAVPGKYAVSLAKRVDGQITELAGPVPFEAVAIGTSSLPPSDRAQLLAFSQKTARLQRAALGAVSAARGRAEETDPDPAGSPRHARGRCGARGAGPVDRCEAAREPGGARR